MIYDDVFNAVVDMAETAVSGITVGSEPPAGGVAMAIGPTSTDSTFLNKGFIKVMPVLCNGKYSSAETCVQNIGSIHRALTKTIDYPSSDTYQIINIDVSSGPNIIGREANSNWIYGSTLSVRYVEK